MTKLDFHALLGVGVGIILHYLPWFYISFSYSLDFDGKLLIFAVIASWSAGIAFGAYRYERLNENRNITEIIKDV